MGCTTSHEKDPLPDDAYCKSTPSSHKNGRAPTATMDMGDQYFSQHQKRLLRETWKIISEDQQNHGVKLFLRIFHHKPETKKLFPFGHLSDDDLLHNVVFRSHAKRFMHAVDTTIQNLDALEVALIPVLLRFVFRVLLFCGIVFICLFSNCSFYMYIYIYIYIQLYKSPPFAVFRTIHFYFDKNRRISIN